MKKITMTSKEVIKLLEKNGWSEARQNGSHKIFRHTENPNNVSVPVHSGKDIPIGTLKSILKIAGLKP
jgi:predicted RNA binding protein YcfA (HicA-like mRNA interferase family)